MTTKATIYLVLFFLITGIFSAGCEPIDDPLSDDDAIPDTESDQDSENSSDDTDDAHTPQVALSVNCEQLAYGTAATYYVLPTQWRLATEEEWTDATYGLVSALEHADAHFNPSTPPVFELLAGEYAPIQIGSSDIYNDRAANVSLGLANAPYTIRAAREGDGFANVVFKRSSGDTMNVSCAWAKKHPKPGAPEHFCGHLTIAGIQVEAGGRAGIFMDPGDAVYPNTDQYLLEGMTLCNVEVNGGYDHTALPAGVELPLDTDDKMAVCTQGTGAGFWSQTGISSYRLKDFALIDSYIHHIGDWHAAYIRNTRGTAIIDGNTCEFTGRTCFQFTNRRYILPRYADPTDGHLALQVTNNVMRESGFNDGGSTLNLQAIPQALIENNTISAGYDEGVLASNRSTRGAINIWNETQCKNPDINGLNADDMCNGQFNFYNPYWSDEMPSPFYPFVSDDPSIMHEAVLPGTEFGLQQSGQIVIRHNIIDWNQHPEDSPNYVPCGTKTGDRTLVLLGGIRELEFHDNEIHGTYGQLVAFDPGGNYPNNSLNWKYTKVGNNIIDNAYSSNPDYVDYSCLIYDEAHCPDPTVPLP